MKKYIQILCALFVMTMAMGCKEYLDVRPANVLSISTFKDVKSLLGAHLRMFHDGYVQLSGTSIPFYDTDDYLITYFYTDDYNSDKYLENFMGRNNMGAFKRALNWQHPDVSDWIWGKHFTNIGYYNMVLDELDKHHDGASQEEIEQVKGEVKFLRAWSFFYLVQLFSPYHNNELGLPINTDPDAVGTYNKSRKTQKENYDFILGELTEILNYKAEPQSDYNVFYNKRIIKALLAEVYLYKGDSGAKEPEDYAKAAKYAKEAMDGRLSLEVINRMPGENDDYGVKTEESYSLISFLYNDMDRLQNMAGFPLWGAFQFASDDLYSLFPDNDRRKSIYFNKNKAIIKFNSKLQKYFCKWDFFTAAEMQLIIAESLAREGKDAEAESALEVFCKSRYDNYVADKSKDLLQRILDERRKEFCYEYMFRWLDMTRLQKGFSRNAQDKQDKKKMFVLEDGDFRFCMPLPKKSELENNKIEQNPGWELF